MVDPVASNWLSRPEYVRHKTLMKEKISSYAVAGSACSLLEMGMITLAYHNRNLMSRDTWPSLLMFLTCYSLPLFGVWFSLVAKRKVADPNKCVTGERLANAGLIFGFIEFAVLFGSIV